MSPTAAADPVPSDGADAKSAVRVPVEIKGQLHAAETQVDRIRVVLAPVARAGDADTEIPVETPSRVDGTDVTEDRLANRVRQVAGKHREEFLSRAIPLPDLEIGSCELKANPNQAGIGGQNGEEVRDSGGRNSGLKVCQTR